MVSSPEQEETTMTAQTAGPVTQSADSTERRWLKYYDPEVPAHLSYPRVPLYQLLRATAQRYPDRDCVIFYGRHFTYRQIRDYADRLAAGAQRLGIQAGDRVGLLLPNCPQFLIAYYGLLKIGAVIVPLNPLYTEHELEFHLTDSGAQTVFTIPLFLEKIAPLAGKTPLKRLVNTRLADFLPVPLNLAQRLQETRLTRRASSAPLVEFKTLLQKAPSSAITPEPIDP